MVPCAWRKPGPLQLAGDIQVDNEAAIRYVAARVGLDAISQDALSVVLSRPADIARMLLELNFGETSWSDLEKSPLDAALGIITASPTIVSVPAGWSLTVETQSSPRAIVLTASSDSNSVAGQLHEELLLTYAHHFQTRGPVALFTFISVVTGMVVDQFSDG